jgi:DNA-binding transcriptional LysR family regulator
MSFVYMASKIKIDIPENIDWELLRRFNIVAHSTTFSEAIKKIGTNQHTISRQIDALEETLGVKLFYRVIKHRSIELTQSGEKLKIITSKIFDIVKNQIGSDFVSQKKSEPRPVLKILTTPGLSTTLLPKLCNHFLSYREEVRIELMAQIQLGNLNIGEIQIRHDRLPQKNLKVVKICTITSGFYAAESYLAHHGMPGSFDDLAFHKVLASRYYSMLSTASYGKLSTENYSTRTNKTVHLEPFVCSDSIGFLAELALTGHGILQLPETHPATQSLTRISSIPPQEKDIHAMFLDMADQTKVVYDFINMVEEKKNG